MSREKINGIAWATNSHAENTQEDGLRLFVDWVICSFYFASKVADLLIVFLTSKYEVFLVVFFWTSCVW